MGNIFACIGTSLAWCCCSASCSLLASCCGTEKGADIPPGAASGRKRSVFLLMLSIGIAFGFQYGVAPAFLFDEIRSPGVVNYLRRTWYSDCIEVYGTYALSEKCSGNSGVYRVAASDLLFYTLAGIAAYCKPTANREAWAAKFTLFLFLVAGTIFIPTDPLFDPILLNIFRAGAVVFILFQQLIFIDVAYNVNESWVEKAEQLEIDEGEGAGKKWFFALLFLCAVFFSGSFVSIGFMYKYFTGCGTNLAFITITLVSGLINTVLQLTIGDASLFTSASIYAYSTYLCYVAVSKNPDGNCNPALGDNDVTGIILGIVLTLFGLAWTGWSVTAHKTVAAESDAKEEEEFKDDKAEDVNGVVLGESKTSQNYGSMEDGEEQGVPSDTFSNSWKLNAILALLTCWFAMSLTSWGSIMDGGNLANPQVGRVSMWMVISSQWLMIVLYTWTLVAPKLFPDRDFS